MQVTIAIPDEMVARVRGVEVKRDMTKLPQAALDHIFAYGFQRVNNDGGAVGKDESDADAVAKSDKKWNALVAGTIRVQSSREGDPVMAEALRIATGALQAAYKKTGKKVADLTAAQWKAEAKARIETNPKILEVAKANVEAARTLGDLEV